MELFLDFQKVPPPDFGENIVSLLNLLGLILGLKLITSKVVLSSGILFISFKVAFSSSPLVSVFSVWMCF